MLEPKPFLFKFIITWAYLGLLHLKFLFFLFVRRWVLSCDTHPKAGGGAVGEGFPTQQLPPSVYGRASGWDCLSSKVSPANKAQEVGFEKAMRLVNLTGRQNCQETTLGQPYWLFQMSFLLSSVPYIPNHWMLIAPSCSHRTFLQANRLKYVDCCGLWTEMYHLTVISVVLCLWFPQLLLQISLFLPDSWVSLVSCLYRPPFWKTTQPHQFYTAYLKTWYPRRSVPLTNRRAE